MAETKQRQRAPGGGRKPKIEKRMKLALSRLRERFPDVMDALLEAGIGLKTVACPNCKHKFDVPVPKDSNVLIHLDNRIQGKPKQIEEINILGTIDLSAGQLYKFLDRLHEKEDEYFREKLSLVAEKIANIKNPLLLAAPASSVDHVQQAPETSHNGQNTTYQVPIEANSNVDSIPGLRSKADEIRKKLDGMIPGQPVPGGSEVEISTFT